MIIHTSAIKVLPYNTKIGLLGMKSYGWIDNMRLICLLVLTVAGMSALASGHMLYAEFSEEIFAPSVAEVWITYGHDEDEQTVPDLPMARAISPDGASEDLDLEEYQGGLLGEVDVQDEGCYVLDLEKEPRLSDMEWFGINGPASFILEYGRVMMVAKSGSNYDWSSGDGLEIVPKTDPSDLEPGALFEAQVLWEGDPIEGDYNAMVVRTPKDVLMIQHAQEVEVFDSSSDGLVEFELTRPGLWVVTFEATIDESGTWTATSDGVNGNYEEGDLLDYDQITPTAYLTFWCR